MKPYFSIVIPIYNRAKVIVSALKSCFEQTFQDFEIIIVDDGSTDDIASVIQSIKSDKITFIRQSNKGGANARNTGISNSNGKYIAFLDSDDRFHEKKLEVFKNIIDLKKDNFNVFYSSIRVIRENGIEWRKPERGIYEDESISNYLFVSNQFIQTSTVVVESRLAKQSLFTEGLIYGQDTDFCLNLEREGASFYFINNSLTDWYDEFNFDRVSRAKDYKKVVSWLEDRREYIGEKAYFSYRGFHVAKMASSQSLLLAVSFYLGAVYRGCYKPRDAVRIFLQIILSETGYRKFANNYISMRKINNE